MNSQQLGALFHLSSPALPIGGYSYSQGFEAAVEAKLVKDQGDALNWILNSLQYVLAKCEAIVWIYLFNAWQSNNTVEIDYWNNWFWASRDTSEFRGETEQMGWSLVKLTDELNWGNVKDREFLNTIKPVTLPTAHSFVCHAQHISVEDGLNAYLFSWIENQVMSAIKTIPLGQIAGQKILIKILQILPEIIEKIFEAASMNPAPINTFAPQLSILSSRHEQQYSRLFRS